MMTTTTTMSMRMIMMIDVLVDALILHSLVCGWSAFWFFLVTSTVFSYMDQRTDI
jgi:hypothetical protein